MASDIAMDGGGVALKVSGVPSETKKPLNISCSIDLCVLECTFGFFSQVSLHNLPISCQESQFMKMMDKMEESITELQCVFCL